MQHQFHSDPNWDLLFSNGKNKWHYLVISVYEDVYHITEGINSNSIEIKKDGSLNQESNYENPTDKNWNFIFNGKDNSYKFTLWGNAMSRLAETLKIYLGLYNAKLPVAIDEPKEIRNRLLGQDNIGIVPEFQSLHRANQSFDDESVHDAIHLYDFKNYQKQIIGIASWEQLPCLMTL